MNELTEEQKEKAIKNFYIVKSIIKSIKKNTKMIVFKIHINILIKLNQIQKNQKNIKTKKKNIMKEQERKGMKRKRRCL